MIGLFASIVLAASAPTPPPATAPTITVVAPRRETVRDFIWKVGQTGGDDQLARWGQPICPQAIGAAGYADFFVQRVKGVAEEVGAPVASGKCDANLLLVFTPDPDRIIKALRQDHSSLFRGEHAVNTGMFLRPKPVYVIQKIDPASRSGQDLTPLCTSAASCLPTSLGDLPTASRLSRNFTDAIGLTIVVVDTRAMKGVTFGALANYIAEEALAQFSPDARVADMPTILNLFVRRDAGERVPVELTEWDKAYLGGLYHTPANLSAMFQRSEIYQRLKDGPGIKDDPGKQFAAKGGGPAATAP